MTPTIRHTLLGTMLAITAAASPARASFQYDLRLAPGQAGATDPHNVALTPSSPTTYTLQLWGQISGDSNLTNDGFVYGYVNVESAQGPAPAFTSGGITDAQTGSHVSALGARNGNSSNITDDGVSDWGLGSSNSWNGVTYSLIGSTLWMTGQVPGYLAGTADSQSHQVNANTWEVLIATYSVSIGSISSSAGTTSFDILAFPVVRSGLATFSGVIYYQDDPLASSGGATLADKQNAFSIIGNVTFSTSVTDPGTPSSPDILSPEPASLTLLALGALPLLNRRRRHP